MHVSSITKTHKSDYDKSGFEDHADCQDSNMSVDGFWNENHDDSSQ